MTAKGLLIEARKKIAEDGWTQGWYHNQGRYCAMGALFFVTNTTDPTEFDSAVEILKGVVGENVVAFNDARGRTQDEVLAAFDKAIQKAA